MAVTYQVMTSAKVTEFARETRFPGWYIDVNGCYGCQLGKFWISVFENDDGALDIAVDTVGEEGFFDNNVEWETPEDNAALADTAKRFLAKYAALPDWALPKSARPAGGCAGCRWKDRRQKCSCCRRNACLKDCYEEVR